MDPITMGLIFGGLGAGQNLMQQKAQQQADYNNAMANATAIRYSPWTHMQVGLQQGHAYSPAAGAIGGFAQGGAQGAMFGQQFKNPQGPSPMQNATSDLDFQKKFMDVYGTPPGPEDYKKYKMQAYGQP